MKNLTSNDLKTLLEYVNKKDETVQETLIEEIQSVKEHIVQDVQKKIFEEVKTNPEFRGPTGYTGADGEPGPQGPIGEQGPMGVMPNVDIDPAGRIRFQTGINENTGMAQFSEWINIKGEKGDTLTWHDLTESQRQMLAGPTGPQGQKGDPGSFPKFQVVPEEFKIRWQVSEDVENPWGDWLELPRGPQGVQGIQGERFVYEDFTPNQLEEIRGPQGFTGEKGDDAYNFNEAVVDEGVLKLVREDGQIFEAGSVVGPQGPQGEVGPVGPQGPKGEKGNKGQDADPVSVAAQLKSDASFLKATKGDQGEKGEPGKDADMDLVIEKIEKSDEEIKRKQTNYERNTTKKINGDFEKTKNELINKIDNVRFTRLNELLIPTQAFNVAGDPTGSEVVQEVGPFSDFYDIVDGAPVYIDNPIKASLRGETYDPDNFIIYADASDVVSVADGIIFKGVGRYAHIYRIGVATVDPRVIADGPELVPGEYYYLAHPKEGMVHSQITVNKPQFGVAQLVGQAIDKLKLFVNCTTDPVVLNRTNLQIQGSNGSYLQPPATVQGNPGDAFGDTIWDDNYVYFCVRDYDGFSPIWRRSPIDMSW